MAKTKTAPWDSLNKDNLPGFIAGQRSRIMEEGRQQFRDEVLSPLMGKLKEIDAEWDPWWEATIPDGASLRVISRLVAERIVEVHRSKDMLVCPEDCWCWDIEAFSMDPKAMRLEVRNENN